MINNFNAVVELLNVAAIKKQVEGITPERLQEICEAERAGRLAMLPKRGDRLFYYPYSDEPTLLRNTGDGSGIVEAVQVSVRFDNWNGWVPLSKTREAASAALKGEAE